MSNRTSRAGRRPQPILGYASKSEAAASLRRQGMTYTQIADALGINSVGGLLRKSGLQKHRPHPVGSEKWWAARGF